MQRLGPLDEDSVDAPRAPPTSPAPEPPRLPSFGLGLKRQKSFGHAPSLITDSELAVQTEQRSRCALALTRIARRSFRGGAIPRSLRRANTTGAIVGVTA